MKPTYIFSLVISLNLLLVSCGGSSGGSNREENAQEKQNEKVDNTISLNQKQVKNLNISIDTLPQRLMGKSIQVNGMLRVPPQHEAKVTSIIGANVQSIAVIEGDRVEKGDLLATLSHPDLIRLQTDYIKSYNQLEFAQKEYERQKKLYEEEVGSGKAFQQIKSEYFSLKGEVAGYEAQLKQLGISPSTIRNGDVRKEVPVVSPFDGYVEKVKIQIGQYVTPSQPMVMIVNNDHVHADFMVFEKDAHKVKIDQPITFSLSSMPERKFEARIYSVGKKFEQNPKAIHVHAEIKSHSDTLIPGMYINGTVHLSDEKRYILPEGAFVDEEGKTFIYQVVESGSDQKDWHFKPVEVKRGIQQGKWVEVKPLSDFDFQANFVHQNAYYLISEMKKNESGHSH
ncbi:efflux RND transporter periplasmic adaptor subunit [Salibacter halophilus]|uniref:Efflux RND transporter periplasmic adaptor subunit n=1 Tax=Salibacter halophilus TaxID=1803916 RepID=A0A6N6M8F6_9FLAO|nr:efflux RND transporter periplasmic adaptor subunit [Salibacter halophilus]KAB1064384.1 efflux RND transporter periplasmic adaptor subunit [Salibacter halophilus]